MVRFFGPRVGWWHTVSAFAYCFSPVGLGLFRPSPIFAVYAVAPWIVAAALHGASGRQPWRWAAVSALAIAFVAPIELPGTVYVLGFIPLIIGALVVVSPGARLVPAFGWVWRSALLTTVCMAPVVVRTFYAQGALQRRLFVTEAPEAVAVASSWSEVYRGMGNWLTYFRFGLIESRPNFDAFLSNPWVIAASLAVPFVALLPVLGARNVAGRVAVALGVTSLIAVVGLYPISDPSPAGRALGWAFDNRPSSQAFRNTLKAGWLWALVVAVLFGAAVSAAGSIAGRRRRPGVRQPLAAIAAGLGIAMVIAASWPAWSGNLYPPGSVEEIPTYWHDATDWLNDNQEHGLVLVLPGTPAAEYRWGDPGDDIFEALLRRPYVSPNFFATSNETTTNLWSELEARLNSEHLEDTSIAPILRRMGVRYLVLRNDLAWNGTNLPRPIALQPLRADPAFALVASFGLAGENTVAPLDPNADQFERGLSIFEAGLSPIEIYDLGPNEVVRAIEAGPSVLLQGDGSGWLRAIDAGLLNTNAPVAYADAQDAASTIALLKSGSPVLVTDTNVKRELQSVGPTTVASPAVFDAPSDRFTDVLFSGPGAATTLWTRDAINISSTASSLNEPWHRAQQAFDDDPNTAWKVPFLVQRVGQSITIELREAAPITRIAIQRSGAVTSGFVRIDDGETLSFVFVGDTTELDMGGVVGSEITLGINTIADGARGLVGFAEIDVDGFDLQAARQTPTALVDAAAANPSIGDALADAPLIFAFEREQTNGRPTIENNIRRRFATDTDRTFAVIGEVTPGRIAALDGACQPLLRIDGVVHEARVVPGSAIGDTSTQFVTCAPIALAAGAHLIESVGVRLDRLVIADDNVFSSRNVAEVEVSVVNRDSTSVDLAIGGGGAGTRVVTGISYHDAWVAEADGRPQRTTELDGQLAVTLDQGGPTRLTLRFGPQRAFGASLAVAVLGILGCILLLLPASVTHQAPAMLADDGTKRIAAPLAAAGLAVALAYLAGGTAAAALTACALAVGAGFTWYLPMIAGFALLVAGGAMTLLEDELVASLQFATNRDGAARAIQIGLLLLAASGTVASLSTDDDAVPTAPRPIDSEPKRAPDGNDLDDPTDDTQPHSRWPRELLAGIVLTIVALAVVALRLVAAPGLAPQVRTALHTGKGYVAALDSQANELALAPLAVMADVFGPAPMWLLAFVALAAGTLLGFVAWRQPILAAAPAATALVVSDSAPAVLAIGLLAIALALSRESSTRSALASGIAAGLAGLAVPTAAFVAPFALALTIAGPGRWSRLAAAWLGVGAITWAWWNWVDDALGLGRIADEFNMLQLGLLITPAALHWLVRGVREDNEAPAYPATVP